MRGTWPRPSSAISRSSHPSTFPSIDPSSTPSFTSSRPSPPTRSTRSSPSSTFRPAISSKPQPEKPLSGFTIVFLNQFAETLDEKRVAGGVRQRPGAALQSQAPHSYQDADQMRPDHRRPGGG